MSTLTLRLKIACNNNGQCASDWLVAAVICAEGTKSDIAWTGCRTQFAK